MPLNIQKNIYVFLIKWFKSWNLGKQFYPFLLVRRIFKSWCHVSADFVTQNALPEHMVIKLWCCSCPCWTRGDPFLWRWVTFANRICSVSIANVLSWCSQLKGNRSRLLGFYWLLTYLVCWINIFFLKREVLWIDLCLNNLANKSPQRVCIIINAKIICLLLNRPFFFILWKNIL